MSVCCAYLHAVNKSNETKEEAAEQHGHNIYHHVIGWACSEHHMLNWRGCVHHLCVSTQFTSQYINEYKAVYSFSAHMPVTLNRLYGATTCVSTQFSSQYIKKYKAVYSFSARTPVTLNRLYRATI